MDRDTQLIYEAYFNEGLATAGAKQAADTSGLDKDTVDGMNGWDKIQLGLDIAGISPEVVGTSADAANVAISVTRGLGAALRGEGDEIKRHAINAAISSISMIPFADVAKILKVRTLARSGPAGAKAADKIMKTLRKTKDIAGTGKLGKGAAARQRMALKVGVRGAKAGTKEHPGEEEGPVIDVPGTVEPAPEENSALISPDHFRQRFARKVAA